MPGLALFPLKLILVAYMLSKPLIAVAGLVAAKFFSAIFIKSTWDILRPVARRNPWLAWADNYWQWLERCAKALTADLKARITAVPGSRLMARQARAFAQWAKPRAAALVQRTRAVTCRHTSCNRADNGVLTPQGAWFASAQPWDDHDF